MTSLTWKALALCAASVATPAAALAQAEIPPVSAHGDWAVYVAGSPKECYVMTQPKASDARRGGASVDVNRGVIRLFVSFRPSQSVANEVSFSSGYPLAEAVRVEIGGDAYTLTPGTGESNQWAWPASPAEDARLVAAMRRGADAKVTGVSTRGTTTIDTFSLIGFTAAVTEAEERCR
jgi:invasion protein IalB